MRITNAMMTNTTLVNISRNMRYLDKLIQQIESTKKIQVPSDDPIVASRALKFRTNVAETAQFQRNVQTGLAWMDVTESSFTNVVENLLKQIRERFVEAATGTETGEDKGAVMADVQEYVNQIGVEMNQTYAGRYVFSGFRTDEPPILNADNNKTYNITQTFSLEDIEKTKSYQKPLDNRFVSDPGLDFTTVSENDFEPPEYDPVGPYDYVANVDSYDSTDIDYAHQSTNQPVVHDINVLKLAYQNADGDVVQIPGYTVVPYPADDVRAYDPNVLAQEEYYNTESDPITGDPLPVIHYIPETGELIMSDETASAFPADGVEVNYTKTNFKKGELNPVVYFPCRELPNPTVDVTGNVYQLTEYLSESEALSSSVLTGVYFQLTYDELEDPNLAGNASYAPTLPPGMKLTDDPDKAENTKGLVYYDSTNGQLHMNADTAAMFNNSPVSYVKMMTGTPPEDESPALNLDIDGATVLELGDPDVPDPNRIYNMNDQDMRYEFSTNTFVNINSLAMDVYTDKMYADLQRICDFAASLTISDPKLLEEKYKAEGLSGVELSDAVSRQISDETAKMQAVLYNRFDSMLGLVDRHSENAMKEHTQLGSRMNRLELLQSRLEQDEYSYTQLLSKNEDTDMVKAIVERSAAEAAYQASLKAGASIVQMTLANFIG